MPTEFERKLEQELIQILDGEGFEEDRRIPFKRIRTYEEIGYLTSNAGLVVEMADGREFRLTISSEI